MKKVKNSFIFCIVLTFLFSSIVSGQTKTEVQEADILQQIIQLVVENNPTLKSQINLINVIEQMPEPGAGFINLEELKSGSRQIGEEGTEAPLLTLSQAIQVEQFIQRKLDREKTLSQAKQTYESLKQSLLSNLMTKITEMAKLKNKERNLGELKSFLETRRDSLEKQVRAGIKEPGVLFDLMERIIQTDLEIKNAVQGLEILKLETAVSLGGDKRKDLLDLLNKIEQ